MTETGTDHHHHGLFLSLLTIIQFLVLINFVVAGPNGLTMKLIHRDSIESPLYPGNLTHEERIQRLADQSNARLRYLTASRIDPNAVSFATMFEGAFYIALVGLGTFPGKNPNYQNYYLVIDTGCDQIWTQCEGAKPGFKQTEPLFPYKQSSTYRRVPCNTNPPLCPKEQCVNGLCNYTITYDSESWTSGALATERFTVTTDNGAPETIDNVIFGCGLEQINFAPLTRPGVVNEVAGILGIAGGSKSFLAQLGIRGRGRFSYCFQPWTAGIGTNTYLRFGADADIGSRRGVQTTPMVLFARNRPVHYYVNLAGVSVDNIILPIPEDWFEVHREPKTGLLQGGCIIDSGTPWTVVNERIFLVLRDAVMGYYGYYGMLPLPQSGGFPGFALCYERPPGFENYPTIRFHFHGGAVYTMDRNNAFYITINKFCLAFAAGSDDPASFHVVIGAWQMTSHRFLFDLAKLRLSFVEEDCHMGA